MPATADPLLPKNVTRQPTGIPYRPKQQCALGASAAHPFDTGQTTLADEARIARGATDAIDFECTQIHAEQIQTVVEIFREGLPPRAPRHHLRIRMQRRICPRGAEIGIPHCGAFRRSRCHGDHLKHIIFPNTSHEYNWRARRGIKIARQRVSRRANELMFARACARRTVESGSVRSLRTRARARIPAKHTLEMRFGQALFQGRSGNFLKVDLRDF